MSLKALSRRHIGLISLYWTRYAVRSGAGLVFLLIALTFGLTVAHIVITPIEMLKNEQENAGEQVNRDKIVAEIVKVGRPVIQWVLGIETDEEEASAKPIEQTYLPPSGSGMLFSESPTDPWTDFLLDEKPALLSVIFIILLFGMPLLVSFLAFNQVSGDVQSRGLRYLLLRTERSNIFFGRYLGTVMFSTVVIAIIIAIITFYLGVKIKIYPAGELVVWAIHALIALSILMLPYIAVCSMISATVDSPFLSLVLAKLVIGGVILFAIIGRYAWEPVINLKYALPWGVQNYLLHPELTHSAGAGIMCLGYTAVFLLLGYYRFATRDL